LDGGGKGTGAFATVERRHEFVTGLRHRSVTDHAAAWRETVEAIATSPRYGGLRITPQVGLVPLGPDPDSGLFEFGHLGSGSIPTRDDTTKRLVHADDSAIVLVLIPGSTFNMGALSNGEDDGAPNIDPEAEADESPVHEVTLSPYFLAKHECTQAQWRAMTEGSNPSEFRAGETVGGKPLTSRNPVESVSWEECDLWLWRNRMSLPTEAQWECACRAGTGTPWATGGDIEALGNVANIADRYCKDHGGPRTWRYTLEVDDGHAVHAPAGSFGANGFGIHDAHGNVSEWCRDAYRSYAATAVTEPLVEGIGNRVVRGGSWGDVAEGTRSADRSGRAPRARLDTLGVRPARPLDKE
jgi:formylglycine-generating enzyme required for sulfatase activity